LRTAPQNAQQLFDPWRFPVGDIARFYLDFIVLERLFEISGFSTRHVPDCIGYNVLKRKATLRELGLRAAV